MCNDAHKTAWPNGKSGRVRHAEPRPDVVWEGDVREMGSRPSQGD